MAEKKFQELNLSNAFLFAAALSDPETCRMVLEMILGEKIPNITVMQNADEKNLAKRSRFHQAQMDVAALKPGEKFSQLKPGYVIFICTFDPYGKDAYRYTFENRCLEYDISFGDETRKIILNTKGKVQGDVPDLLVEFLHYVEDSTDSYISTVEQTSEVHKLHDKIKALKKNREWEERYMTFEELLRKKEEDGYAAGHAQGHAEERAKMLRLIQLMADNGETDLIPRLSTEPQFLDEMYSKYELS